MKLIKEMSQQAWSDFKSLPSYLQGLIALAIGGVIIYTIIIFVVALAIEKISFNDIGSFGDSFGAMTSFFSCLTVIGLLITISQQREANQKQHKANELQQSELELTLKELQKATEIHSQQSNTIRLQQFENTFFKLIELFQNNKINTNQYLNNTVNGFRLAISFEDEDITHDENGIPFSVRFQQLKKDCLMLEQIKPKLINSISRHRHLIQPWFTQVKTILDFIDKSEIDDKSLYVKIFISQLYPEEHAMLFYTEAVNPLEIKIDVLNKYGGIAEQLHTSKIFPPHLDQYQAIKNRP